MEELFSGPATFLDDVCALATTGGKGFANILEEVNKEYEKEVVAELERLQLSRGNPESSKNDDEAADCEELEDAYDLLFKDGEKPVPIRDFTEIKENSSGTKTKTFKNIPKQYSHVEEFNKFKLKMNQKQVAAKQSIPQGVMTRSQEEATAILKKLASEGELYALQKYQGGMRSAKITYSKDKLLLHRLRKKHPPSGVNVVCYNDVMKLVDPSSRLTFLCLGEKDYINFGKVFIRLHGDTLAAKHFSCLCTGERGPTYAGFTCVDVFNKNHKTLEYFRMGDYENCNGTGGKPLFPGLNSNQDDYIRPWVAGTVEGCWVWKSEISAQFDILMKDNPGRMCEAAFGIVEEGLTQDSGSESHSVVSLSDSDAGLPHANGYHDDETTLYCPSHQGQTLRFYCRDCETAVCSSCTDIEHRAHNTLHLTDAVEEHRLAMHQLIDRVTMQLPCVKESICDIQDVSRNLREKRTEAEKEIRRCFDILHELLDKRQTTLINSLNTIESEKQQTLDNQKEELEAWVCGVESGCEFVEKALAHCPAMEVVLVRKQLGERLMDYANMNVPPAPRENSHLKFVVGNIDPLKTAFLHVGSIQSNSAVPHQTSATGESLRQVTVGRQAIVTVVTRDHKGEKASCGGAEVTAAISRTSLTVTRHGSSSPRASSLSPRASSKSPSGSREELCQPQVLDLNNGTYEVAFTVHGEGTYCLEVLLYGHSISGSPFSIAAIPPLEEDSGSSQRSVPPHTLARQQSHSTQVTSRASRASRRPLSHRSSCSRRTNPIEDDMLLRVGRRGRNRGEFVNPQGIAYNAIKDGRIAVADSNNQCIQVFTLAGECKLRFGVRGRSIGQMQRPTGVAALPNGNYVVADYENKWVSIFEPSGKFVTRIGHGKLLGPKGVCVDNNGHIIVVDNKASCVCIFQQSGKLLTKFGNRGTDEFQFAGPHFAAVNSMGHIVITDFHNHCVKVFDSDGDFLFTFGTSGEGNGQFNAPTGVAVDSNDNIIVADWGNSRIQVFDSQGSFLSYVNTLADPLYGPQGMTLTPDGQIFVADSGNHCFKVYKYLQ